MFQKTVYTLLEVSIRRTIKHQSKGKAIRFTVTNGFPQNFVVGLILEKVRGMQCPPCLLGEVAAVWRPWTVTCTA